MPTDAVSAMRCPVCRGGLSVSPPPRRSLLCSLGHSYDAAKQGYYNFLTGKGTAFEADSADMVAARFAFLDAGHYAPLQELVAETVSASLTGRAGASRKFPSILDAGTGTGHYLRSVLDKAPGAAAVGLDISKFALRRAARLNPDAINVVWDIWQPLPITDAAMDVVMVVFAPRNPAEFARVLRPGGRLLVVTPLPRHLAEIADRTGMLGIEDNKEDRLAAAMASHFESDGGRNLEFTLHLNPGAVADAAFMGPAGHHLDRSALRAVAASTDDVTEATARFRISLFTPRKHWSGRDEATGDRMEKQQP